MTKTMVADLKPGARIDTYFLVARKQLLPFRDPSRGYYLSLTLADRTGRVEARLWEGAAEVAEAIHVDTVARVTGTVEDYRGSLQVSLASVAPAPAGTVDPADLIPVTTSDMEALQAELRGAIDSISDPWLGAFLKDWFADAEFYQNYIRAPAAKRIHHSYLGGLLEHSLEVLRLCRVVAASYPEADRDVLVAAALLHDVGKVEEYRYLLSIDLTDRGRLIGHTVIGYEMLRERSRRFGGADNGRVLHLGHIILAHHGEMEYGAPIVPQTLESAIIHHADLLSGRVRQFYQILQGPSSGDWTEYDRLLGRHLYRGFTVSRPWMGEEEAV